MSDPTTGELLVQMNAMAADIEEIKGMLKEHAAAMDERMGAAVSQTNAQEVRISILEEQLRSSITRGAKMADDVAANKLSLAKASAIAACLALVIPVVVEVVGNAIVESRTPHTHQVQG